MICLQTPSIEWSFQDGCELASKLQGCYERLRECCERLREYYERLQKAMGMFRKVTGMLRKVALFFLGYNRLDTHTQS